MTLYHIRRGVTLIAAVIMTITGALMCGNHSQSTGERLAEWRKGVWITGTGTYTIYTDSHYFVVSFEGDSLRPNLYVGASQIRFCDRGMARQQVLRVRKVPGNDPVLWRETRFTEAHTEGPIDADTSLFTPGTCVIEGGVIYDAVTETTDDFILLSTCNGDKERIYSDGRSVYLPKAGGEFYSYRVEQFH